MHTRVPWARAPGLSSLAGSRSRWHFTEGLTLPFRWLFAPVLSAAGPAAKPPAFPLSAHEPTWLHTGAVSFPFTTDRSRAFVISFPSLCSSEGWLGGPCARRR